MGVKIWILRKWRSKDRFGGQKWESKRLRRLKNWVQTAKHANTGQYMVPPPPPHRGVDLTLVTEILENTLDFYWLIWTFTDFIWTFTDFIWTFTDFIWIIVLVFIYTVVLILSTFVLILSRLLYGFYLYCHTYFI